MLCSKCTLFKNYTMYLKMYTVKITNVGSIIIIISITQCIKSSFEGYCFKTIL